MGGYGNRKGAKEIVATGGECWHYFLKGCGFLALARGRRGNEDPNSIGKREAGGGLWLEMLVGGRVSGERV